MASIIEGYNYDVFISYRQKDNKHDGWVTEFVDNLKGELEATFKEDISVYFDINPHDGLLETHDVNASLKEKLKSLIFIPIISQTYCDPKSFAWQYEFCTFNYLAKEDQFGRDIRLSNGNIASRILPARIHELDPEDKALLESEIGGVLRCIDFIYKSPGVNRPLRSNEEHPLDNLNKIYYRDQVNKVANGIKEIIAGLRNINGKMDAPSVTTIKAKPLDGKNPKKLILAFSIAIALIVIGFLIIQKLLKPFEYLEKSIAVLPFINDSPDQENTYFINGIMEEILNDLQMIKDFRVISRTSTEQFTGINKPTIHKIAKDLNVNYIVEGSGQKYGDKVVLRVQLIAAKDEKHLWGDSFQREIKETSDIIDMQSQIAQSIASKLKATITPEESQIIKKIPTFNLTALDCYQRGREEYIKYTNANVKDWVNITETNSLKKAILYFKQAIKSDSTFAQAYTGLALAKFSSYWTDVTTRMSFSESDLKLARDSVLTLINKALFYNKNLEEAYIIKGSLSQNPDNAISEFRKALEINPNYGLAYANLANILFYGKNDHIESIKYELKALELERGPNLSNQLKQLGSWWELFGFYQNAADIYLKIFQLTKDTLQYYQDMSGPYYAGQDFKESIRWAKKTLLKDPNYLWAHHQLLSLYSFMGNMDSCMSYAHRFVELSNNQADKEFYIGYLSWLRGDITKARAEFEKTIDFTKKQIDSEVSIDLNCMTISSIYSMIGNQKKALEYFSRLSENFRSVGWFICVMEHDPVYQNIRDTKKFKDILSKSISKWQSDHDKIKSWLISQGMTSN